MAITADPEQPFMTVYCDGDSEAAKHDRWIFPTLEPQAAGEAIHWEQSQNGYRLTGDTEYTPAKGRVMTYIGGTDYLDQANPLNSTNWEQARRRFKFRCGKCDYFPGVWGPAVMDAALTQLATLGVREVNLRFLAKAIRRVKPDTPSTTPLATNRT